MWQSCPWKSTGGDMPITLCVDLPLAVTQLNKATKQNLQSSEIPYKSDNKRQIWPHLNELHSLK